jgi:hypothetical protein
VFGGASREVEHEDFACVEPFYVDTFLFREGSAVPGLEVLSVDPDLATGHLNPSVPVATEVEIRALSLVQKT